MAGGLSAPVDGQRQLHRSGLNKSLINIHLWLKQKLSLFHFRESPFRIFATRLDQLSWADLIWPVVPFKFLTLL